MSNPKIIMPTETDSYNLLDYDGINAGYRADIIDAITQRMDDALKHHSQILTVPLVIRYPESIQAAISTHWEQDRQKGKHYRSNPCFNYFLEVYRKLMNAKEKRLLHYVWVMEKKFSVNPHYHLILILNGNLMRYFAIPPFTTRSSLTPLFQSRLLSPCTYQVPLLPKTTVKYTDIRIFLTIIYIFCYSFSMGLR